MEKISIVVFPVVLPEGSTTQLRNILKKNMDVVAEQQYEIFNAMQNKGFYQLKEAQDMQIDETKKMFSKKSS